jgi:hypothetical protein
MRLNIPLRTIGPFACAQSLSARGLAAARKNPGFFSLVVSPLVGRLVVWAEGGDMTKGGCSESVTKYE